MNRNIHSLLLSTVCDSISSVIPRPIGQAVEQASAAGGVAVGELGVAIRFEGMIGVRMVMDGERRTFSKISEVLFGMAMEGEMLDSCVGEIANIIAGSTTTLLSNHGIAADITPPSLLGGDAVLDGYESALALNIEEVGEMRIMLLGGH